MSVKTSEMHGQHIVGNTTRFFGLVVFGRYVYVINVIWRLHALYRR